ncbi:hypothetical protein [Homoserinibacter sp. GY 40078]|uniref:hypothetical protein n=1 Tax=Homoserinibacter sp. GY 40078 TaxID=2603275 RepID=UPI0011CAC1BE|nr:hypothetical protein [Homoserinibacter sp. GY 40078]TXK17717.1 hypothetical protein FVQ89_13025 [Homoserinibacter sp. GY 40078]
MGFRKRAGSVFTIDIADDVIGFLGYNTASEHTLPGNFAVNPVIGIRNQELARVVSELRGERFHPYAPPTVSSPLGYLMPDPEFRVWYLGPDSPTADGREMVDAIVNYGIPYMKSGATLPRLLPLIEASSDFLTRYYHPVALGLLGEVTRAQRVLHGLDEDLAHLSDPASTRYREFSPRCWRWLSSLAHARVATRRGDR